MTNPLRELMIRQAETKWGEYDAAVSATNAYTQGHLGDIADLIDAAQYFIDMLNEHEAAFGDKLFPKSSDKLRAALVKFTEGK